MSVPGRIGTILIIALALVDAIILASGARHAASAIETHAMIDGTAPQTAQSNTDSVKHERLLSTALRQINLFMAKPANKPTKI